MDVAAGGGGGQSSSSRAAEPGVDSGPRGGGGGQSSSSRAAEPGDEPCVDLEVSSNSSGETLGAAALPEGVDVNWAQLPQTWHLARWCVARAHSVCRRVARVVATANMRNKECHKPAAALHLSLKSGPRGKQRWVACETVHENATQKAQGVLEALRALAETTGVKAERTLSALAACDALRAKALFQLGLRVHDPTASQKTFRRALADLGLARCRSAPGETDAKRPKQHG